MEMTEAETTPVVAASSAPTATTAKASPPRNGPNSCPTVSRRSSAIPERSRIRPMNVKKGSARSVSLVTTPSTLCGSAWNSAGVSRPSSMPTNPNRMPLAARANATGYPRSRNTISVANMTGARLAARNAISAALRLVGPATPAAGGPPTFASASCASSSANSSSAVLPSPLRVGSGFSSIRKPTHLISCEMPAAIRRQKPTGMSSLTGQRTRPPELEEVSPVNQDSQNIGQASHMISAAAGNRKKTSPKISIRIWPRFDSFCARMSTRTWSFFVSA